jgi:hypothetical protein
MSPAAMRFTATVGTTSEPVMPRSSLARAGSDASFSRVNNS